MEAGVQYSDTPFAVAARHVAGVDKCAPAGRDRVNPFRRDRAREAVALVQAAGASPTSFSSWKTANCSSISPTIRPTTRIVETRISSAETRNRLHHGENGRTWNTCGEMREIDRRFLTQTDCPGVRGTPTTPRPALTARPSRSRSTNLSYGKTTGRFPWALPVLIPAQHLCDQEITTLP